MRRIVATVALAVGLLAGNLGFGAVQPAGAGHNHQHTDCAYWAQIYLWYISGGTATLNEWPWYLDGWRDPFLFYGDTHTQCSLKNVYYGYPVWTWALLNIDHTPVDSGTHDWAVIPAGSF
jgi:hypothetical protein